jgi:hypothetical protein
MRRQWQQFVADECGALLVSDWILLATILVIAVVPTMYAGRDKTTGRDLEKIQAKHVTPQAVIPAH